MSCHRLRAYLLDLAPELAATTAEGLARLDRFLIRAEAKTGATAWGQHYDEAVCLQAAHDLTMASVSASGAVGAVTSEKVGDLQRNYAGAPATGAGAGASTGYELQLVKLRRRLGLSMTVL